MNIAESVTVKIKEYIQPFERLLALDELAAITGSKPTPLDGNLDSAIHFSVSAPKELRELTDTLTYWESVGGQSLNVTRQLLLESTSLVARNGMDLRDLAGSLAGCADAKKPNKRCLRYATHGIHEYRGKFFPQLVGALINSANVPTDGMVLDPMCGSGTTLVESVLAGRAAYGLDMNPLSVFVTGVKCDLLKITAETLISSYQKLIDAIAQPIAADQERYFDTLLEGDQGYLIRWFSPAILAELDGIMAAIQVVQDSVIQRFFLVVLSNILRQVSWQKEDDLRVRREVKEFVPGTAISAFLKKAEHETKQVAAFQWQNKGYVLGNHFVYEADARYASRKLDNVVGKVDAIITSPPYATALPYLDTDRLSLIYLGLLPRKSHRNHDLYMIGNREITERTRAGYWEKFEQNKVFLPTETCALIEKIEYLNTKGEAGFRRRNLASLLSKYFFDMKDAFVQQFLLLRDGGQIHMVVGNNTTTADGEKLEINTARHLLLIAEMTGFEIKKSIGMEMLGSRDIFRNNAMKSEQIIIAQKPNNIRSV